MSEIGEGLKKRKETVSEEMKEEKREEIRKIGLKDIEEEKKEEIRQAGLREINEERKEDLKQIGLKELAREELKDFAEKIDEAKMSSPEEKQVVEAKFKEEVRITKPEKSAQLNSEAARFRAEDQKTHADVAQAEIYLGSKAAELHEQEFVEKIREEQLVKKGLKPIELAKKIGDAEKIRIKRPTSEQDKLMKLEAERRTRKERIQKELAEKRKTAIAKSAGALGKAKKVIKGLFKGDDKQ